MKILLWLDDYRNPFEDNWLSFSPISDYNKVLWAKNYDEFIQYITNYGLPAGICFDHDLGFTNEYYIENNLPSPEEEKTGYDCAKWLIEYCINNDVKLPAYNIQSANPVGKENIDRLLKNFIKHYEHTKTKTKAT